MQLLICVLNRTDCLDELLKRLVDCGVTGATILESTGMARAIADPEELPIFGSLRNILDPERAQSRTILIVARKEQVDTVRKVINEVTGGLDSPDTGILIGVPIDFCEGVSLDNG